MADILLLGGCEIAKIDEQKSMSRKQQLHQIVRWSNNLAQVGKQAKSFRGRITFIIE